VLRSHSAGTARSSSLDEIGDRDAVPGSAPWCRYFAHQAKRIRDDMNADIEDLRRVLDSLESHEAWKALDYPSFGMMCFLECKLSAEELEAIKGAAPKAKVAVVLNPNGVKKHDITSDNIRGTPTSFGTDPGYLAARLERDHPDMKARLDRGEFPSVRSAALAAGIVRPTAMFYTDAPADAARAILRHFEGDRLRSLIHT
jgi:hypothetical protein